MDIDAIFKKAAESDNTLQNSVSKQKVIRKEFVETHLLKVDPVYESFLRPQSEEEKKQFQDLIREDGIRDALVVYRHEGTLVVIDGHHRLKAAKVLNIENVPIEVLNFTSPEDARFWMMRNQLGRRNLRDAERIAIALKITEYFQREGLQKQQANLIQNRQNTEGANWHPREKKQERVAQTVAKLSETSPRNVNRFKKVKDFGDEELIQKTLQGEISIHKAHETVKAREAEQKAKRPTPSKGNVYTKDTIQLMRKVEALQHGKINREQLMNYIDRYYKRK